MSVKADFYARQSYRRAVIISALWMTIGCSGEPAPAAGTSQPGPVPIPVTEQNFTRAETHLYFGNSLKEGGAGK